MPRERKTPIALFALALGINLGLLALYYWPETRALSGDENYYLGAARGLLTGEGVRENPFWPPLYGRMLAGSFQVFGPQLLAFQGLQIAMWLGTALFLTGITRVLLPSRAAGVTVLVFSLFSLDAMAYSHLLWPEIPHLFFFVGALYFAVVHGAHLTGAVASGVWLGFALLTKLVALPFSPAVVLAVFFCSPGQVAARGVRALALAAATFLVVLPVTSANYANHGRFVIANSTGLNLWLGIAERPEHEGRVREETKAERSALFAEHARASGEIPGFHQRQDILFRDALERVRQQGLSETLSRQFPEQYFRLFNYEGDFTKRLIDDPWHSYRLQSPALERLLHVLAHAGYAALLVASAFGVCGLRFRRLGWEHFFALFLVYNLGLFLLVHARPRFVMAFFPILVFFAGAAVHAWKTRGENESPVRFAMTPLRLALGAALALLLMVAAFQPPFPPGIGGH